MQKICFTGYRNEKLPFMCDESDKNYINFKNKALAILIDCIEKGAEYFLCGMAQGSDLILAELICMIKKTPSFADKKIFLECVLPYTEHGSKLSNFFTDKHRNALSMSDKTTIICPRYRPECFMLRNEYMVNNCDTVFAIYDGKKGGTKNTFEYSVKKGKKIIILNPSSLKTIYIDMLDGM